jgi:hypothetical protein
MGEAMKESIGELLRLGRSDEAVLLALEHRTAWIQQQLDYQTLNELGEQGSIFLQRWLAELPPLERLQAANWAVSHYGLSLVHLDDASETGARLYLEAQAAAAAALASSMRHVEGFSEGPDASLHPSVPQRLYGYADQLDAMSFEFVPLEAEE